jgi:hypothetical protein
VDVRHFVVVARGHSAVRVPEETELEIRLPTTEVGPATLVFRTRWADEGFASPIPRELWAQVTGDAACSLDAAINAYWQAANAFIPPLVVAANAPADDLALHLAFDATPRLEEHEFFQNFLTDQSLAPHHGRSLAMEQTVAFLDALAASEIKQRERLMRACGFYQQALSYLRPGHEVMFVAFLWMAVEAMTKVALRQVCDREAVTDEELVIRWELASATDDEAALLQAKRGLDGEVRRRLIFHGDGTCQTMSRRASDAFEHGYENFNEVRARAVAAKAAGVAEHVRRAIFELVGLDESHTAFLTSGRYLKPQGAWPITKYIRGTFVGPAEDLAAPNEQYPMLQWSGELREFAKNTDNNYELRFDENLTVLCGPDVGYRAESFEVWGPDVPSE